MDDRKWALLFSTTNIISGLAAFGIFLLSFLFGNSLLSARGSNLLGGLLLVGCGFWGPTKKAGNWKEELQQMHSQFLRECSDYLGDPKARRKKYKYDPCEIVFKLNEASSGKEKARTRRTAESDQPHALPPPIAGPYIKSGKGYIAPDGGFSPDLGAGIHNPQTGEFMPKVGGGFLKPSTGQFIPAF